MQHDEGDLGDIRPRRVRHRYLLPGRRQQCHGGPDDLRRVLGTQRDPHVGGPRLNVELAAEGDVDSDRPVFGDGQLLVQRERERRHVAQPHPAHPPALDPGGGLHQPDCGVDPDQRLRLGCGQAAGLQQGGAEKARQ